MNKKKVVLKSGVQIEGVKFDGETIDISEWIKAVTQWQSYLQQVNTVTEEVSVKISTKRPVWIVFLGDLHVGSIYTRYAALYELLQKISKRRNIYLINCGDVVDNFLPNTHASTGLLETVMPPSAQKLMVEKLFEICKTKWLAMTRGDHENFSWLADDFDLAGYLAKKLNCANLGWGGVLNVTVGQTKYEICIRHRFRFNSSFNLTHTVKRLREMFHDFDIGVVAHGHQPTVEHMSMADKDRVFIRCGAAKITDNYAQRLGFPPTKFYVPAVQLWPDKRKMHPVLNIADYL